jgi:DNA-binding transcriptional LysR family regulator
LSQIQFGTLDLNLLRVFDALIEERSVTRAAARLGLTPSAISHALNRLRYLLKDELFVRGSNGMQPTPRAAEIGPRVRQGLAQLQLALVDTEFMPELTNRQFNVICGDYVGAVLLSGVMARLRAEAPMAELRIRPSSDHIVEDLDAGRADLALGGFGRIPDRFASELLFSDTMVWTLSADHPFASGPLTLERLAALPHLIVAPGEDDRAFDGVVIEHGLERRVIRDDADALDGATSDQGIARKVSLTIPNGLAAPIIVGGSDIAALLPRRLAIAYAERYRLKLFKPPYDSPPFDIMALWHKRLGDQPALTWLRALFRKVAAELT